MEGIIVPCTQEKIWDTQPKLGPVPAKDAYTKPIFRRWRDYAEGSGSPWFILSTRYGLLHPDHPVEPYNVPISAAVQDADLLARLSRQGRELNLAQYNRIVLLDWERFQPLVRAAVGEAAVECVLRQLFS